MLHAQAVKIGKKYQKCLGVGWKTRIHENIGWHLCWRNGSVSVFYEPGVNPAFWAMIGPPDSGVGTCELTPSRIPHFKTPELAVEAACNFAIAQMWKEWAPTVLSVLQVTKQLNRRKRS